VATTYRQTERERERERKVIFSDNAVAMRGVRSGHLEKDNTFIDGVTHFLVLTVTAA
jgi:hypothetical protein